ncbi:MAG: hypothetical protein IJI60_00365 [Bacilli bacterium]|nr:hypothetical protein [Bacilli bacterium]
MKRKQTDYNPIKAIIGLLPLTLIALILNKIMGLTGLDGVKEKDSHTIIPKTTYEQVLESEPEFMEKGKHAIAIKSNFKEQEQQQLPVPDGYELKGINYDIGLSHTILYVNTETVLCYPTGETETGEFVYQDICTPVSGKKEKEEHTQDRDFEIGEHVIIAPIHVESTMQFEFHEGYEVIDIDAYAGSGGSYDGCIVYKNTVPVRVHANKRNKKTSEWIYDQFGTPIEKEKIKTR